jgi:hypothetical protein
MPLSYLRDDYHKQAVTLIRVAAIQIDVHPAGENPTNTPRMLPTPVHVRPVYASCGWSPYEATFHESSIELSRPTAPEKKAPDTIHSASLTDLWVRTQLFSLASQ